MQFTTNGIHHMRLSRVFIEQSLTPGQSLELPAHLVNYLVNVLRLKAGSEIILFNGLSLNDQIGEFSATLSTCSKRQCIVSINQFIVKHSESSLKSHLYQGISRSERMDYSIQKAVELGINSITPVLSQYSNAKKLNDKQLQKKLQHWQGIATSACEQSGRCTWVNINKPVKTEQITIAKDASSLLLSPAASKSLRCISSRKISLLNLLIGPEGGLSTEEINWAVAQGFEPITLGKRVLRTETAGLTVLSIAQFLWGDLG